MPGLTPAQQQAASAQGDVLVMAGAGTGKTRTLVERCLRLVTDPDNRVSLDQVLLVTFTEAAAAEMRRRIRQRLEEECQSSPERPWFAEQLALVDTAWICTLHSFCLRLVREHFHTLALDPEFTLLDDAQADILAGEALAEVMERRYAGTEAADCAMHELVLAYGSGNDEPIRELVLRLHAFVRTLPDPNSWLAEQEGRFRQPEPADCRALLLTAIDEWRSEWEEDLAEFPAGNPKAAECRERLAELAAASRSGHGPPSLRQLLAVDQDWPRGKKGEWRTSLKPLFEEAAFLASLLPELASPPDPAPPSSSGRDPLAEDWDCVRGPMAALLALVREFTDAFAAAKRELGVVDFQDLEQFALRLLWDAAANRPSPIAQALQRDLKYIFVDEYQDVNAVQDRIVEAVSRCGRAANRFLVGDVKQSIYRFRLADPRIFQRYAAAWGQGRPDSTVVALSDNFRSHEAILDVVNRLFASLMRRVVGGVDYEESAWLRFGDRAGRSPLARASLPGHTEGPPESDAARGPTDPIGAEEARVEFHWRVAGQSAGTAEGVESQENENGAVEDRTEAEEEAALVAMRLGKLRDQAWPIWEPERAAFRPVEWRDMVILLRSPRNKAEAYAKVFERAGIPLTTTRRGLYEALEVADLLNLLAILDNPLQDIPTLAVLRSPLVGLGVDELAAIRLALLDGEFWGALLHFHRAGAATEPGAPLLPEEQALRARAWAKADQFLRRHERWRQLARRCALSQCLEAVLDETHYEDWLEVQPRGPQRRANVQRLLGLTRQFDRFQRQGLFRFLRFVEAQQAVAFDPEPAVTEAANAVRLMSVHQSKGLEFPVVVLADLGKRFNFDDTRGTVLLDEQLGLCPQVRPAGLGQSYPSLAHWLATRRLRRETLGEEIRLLYVAATRACDKLILVGSAAAARAEQGWPSSAQGQLTTRQILEARSALDWLGRLLPELTGDRSWFARAGGQHGPLRWRRYDQAVPIVPRADEAVPAVEWPPDPARQAEIEARLAWRYPHQAATLEPAKTSVTALRRRVSDESESECEVRFEAAKGFERVDRTPGTVGRALTPAERGTAHHRFLELATLSELQKPEGVSSEAARVEQAGLLAAEEAAALDLTALHRFWASAVGRRILTQNGNVRRELEFTLRLAPEDFRALGIPIAPGLGADEAMVVQGVVDLAVIRPEAIWIVDYKTDDLTRDELPAAVARYAPQLRLYALALSRIFNRPVTEAWLHFLALDRSEPVV